MTLDKKLNGTTLEIALQGRLDTNTAPTLENAVNESINGITELILDFAALEYVSSAGLRVLLSAQKAMKDKGKHGAP